MMLFSSEIQPLWKGLADYIRLLFLKMYTCEHKTWKFLSFLVTFIQSYVINQTKQPKIRQVKAKGIGDKVATA